MIQDIKTFNPFEGPIMGKNETASAGDNEAEKFFNILFNGNAPEGYLMLWSKDELTKAIPTTDVRQIVETALAFGPQYDVYYGVGIQKAPPIGGSRGTSDGVIAICGLHLDVDILGPNHKSKDLPPDIGAAINFVKESFPLQPSMIVFSGGGLQPYWLFKESYVFENEKDRKKVEAFLLRFQRMMSAKAREKGWKLDTVSDLARVLRIPGTFNHKNGGKVPVCIKEYHPEFRYEPDDFEAYLVDNDPIPPKKPAKTTRFKNSLPPADANLIEEGCAWFRHCKDDAVGLPEPEWYAWLSILGKCTNGEQLAHDWSSVDSRYKPEETATKLDHALQSAGPRSCQNIRYNLNGEEYCKDCPAWGHIQSPIQLGRLKNQLPNAAGSFSASDYGNAERLVSEHGDDIRYCFLWDRWYTWNESRWEQDITDEITRKAKNTVRKIKAEAAVIADSRSRESLEKHAIRSESLAGLRNMVQLAKSEHGIPTLPDTLDSDPMLFNCLNGTLDLRTGTLLEHERSHLLTKMAPVNFDLNATCDLWLKFLDTIMGGKQELIDFLQRAIGYSLTGDTSEQCLFFLHGTGANGKSTFLEIIRHLIGDYAKQADFSTFLAQKGERIRNDIAGLKGSRLVSAVEVEAGKKLSEVLVKQLTGGDAITARFLYGEFFEFYPTFKVFWVANHLPIVKGTDYGFWRRPLLIPFSVTIPKEQQDRRLLSKLKAELPGIFNWAVKGCLEWQKSGLNPPLEVVNATRSYQQEMDVLGDFLADCCVIGPKETVTVKKLYEAYTSWCGSIGDNPLGKQQFNSTLRERNLKSEKKNGPMVWFGIGLKPQANDVESLFQSKS